MQQVIVNIDADGNVKIEAVGFKGNACEKATAAIEKAMGSPKGRAKKPEYFVQQGQQQKAGI
jgi:hypothetical protein